MFTNEQVLAASRAIRPLLPKLIPALADQIDLQLAQLLNQPDLDEDTQVDRLVKVFDAHPESKSWLDQFLSSLLPSEDTTDFPAIPHLLPPSPTFAPSATTTPGIKRSTKKFPSAPPILFP